MAEEEEVVAACSSSPKPLDDLEDDEDAIITADSEPKRGHLVEEKSDDGLVTENGHQSPNMWDLDQLTVESNGKSEILEQQLAEEDDTTTTTSSQQQTENILQPPHPEMHSADQQPSEVKPQHVDASAAEQQPETVLVSKMEIPPMANYHNELNKAAKNSGEEEEEDDAIITADSEPKRGHLVEEKPNGLVTENGHQSETNLDEPNMWDLEQLTVESNGKSELLEQLAEDDTTTTTQQQTENILQPHPQMHSADQQPPNPQHVSASSAEQQPEIVVVDSKMEVPNNKGDAGGSPSLVASGFNTVQTVGAAVQLQIQIPNEKVCLIKGKDGETTKNLQTRSGSRIQLIPRHQPEGDQSKNRTLRVTGDKKQIQMVRKKLRSPPGQVYRDGKCYVELTTLFSIVVLFASVTVGRYVAVSLEYQRQVEDIAVIHSRCKSRLMILHRIYMLRAQNLDREAAADGDGDPKLHKIKRLIRDPTTEQLLMEEEEHQDQERLSAL